MLLQMLLPLLACGCQDSLCNLLISLKQQYDDHKNGSVYFAIASQFILKVMYSCWFYYGSTSQGTF